MAAPAPPPARPSRAAPGSDTRFFGSQIGGKSLINYSYTDMPWKLMAWDVYYFFKYFRYITYIIWPLSPADSADLSELSPTRENLFCVAVHIVLCVLQLSGIVALPLLVLVPVWATIAAVAVFLLVNAALCTLLNGEGVEYRSDPKYAPALPKHAHEQWIYINGVAAGKHWMQSNLNRLAVTFKRPILGIHNKTSGILFDVIECLIQRNWGYATKDVRVCYQIIKKTLYDPRYSKVIFILHSQGGIEGGMVLDWLLQELPQDLLSKLEVYTFGNAANHFNNPHRHIRSQTMAKLNPLAAAVDSTRLASHEATPASPERLPQAQQPRSKRHPRHSTGADVSNSSSSTSISSGADTSTPPSSNSTASTTPPPHPPPLPTATPPALVTTSSSSSTTTPHPSALSDRAIGHIEHYAHTTDFVALWGVLHFATTRPASQTVPRFLGRVFLRASPKGRGGHQMVQHYLDGMFPLRRHRKTGRLLRGVDGVPVGVVGGDGDGEGEGEGGRGGLGVNEFMESEVWVTPGVDEWEEEEGGEEGKMEKEEVEVLGVSPTSSFRGGVGTDGVGATGEVGVKMKVKELSRLWQYRNGRSPEETAPLLVRGVDGVVRGATM